LFVFPAIPQYLKLNSGENLFTKFSMIGNENLLTYAQFQDFPDMKKICIGTKEGFLIFQEPKGNLGAEEKDWKLSASYSCGGCSIVCCNNRKMVIVAGEIDENQCDIENSPRVSRIYKLPPPDEMQEPIQIARIGFETPILKIFLFNDFIIYIMESEIRLHDVPKNPNELKLRLNSRLNPKGVFTCSGTMIAYPKISTKAEASIAIYDTVSRKEKLTVTTTHHSPLEFIQFNSDGSLIATAAEDGLLIKIYSAIDGYEKHIFRRATINKAQICSMVFNNDRNAQLLAVASSKGTVHIFDLKEGAPKVSPSIYDAGIISTASSLVEATTVGAEARSFCVVRLSPPVSSSLSFSADSKIITTLGDDGKVQRWTINKTKAQGLLGNETAADCEKDQSGMDWSVQSYMST
jgi:WD40 repeat protein